jgi:site-specific recombinase XerD
MNLLTAFQDFLFSQKNPPTRVTVKNYLADIRRFIRWYESRGVGEFTPAEVTTALINRYREDLSDTSPRSAERYMSSLRKFFSFLHTTELISSNPFRLIAEAEKKEPAPDPWQLIKFKEFLYREGISPISSKNYVLDLEQFFTWLTQVAGNFDHYDLNERNLFSKIDRGLLEEYKRRLITETQASPNTINRKLSSLRRYVLWAEKNNLIKKITADSLPTNVADGTEKEEYKSPGRIAIETNVPVTVPEKEALPVPDAVIKPAKKFSVFPPLRLLQRSSNLGTILFDVSLVIPVSFVIDKLSYSIWRLRGTSVFVPAHKNSIGNRFVRLLERHGLLSKIEPKKADIIANLPKSFYAPLAISLRYAPIHRKAWHHVRYTRPGWYRKYHSYKFVHYIHAAVLVLSMSAVGFGVVQAVAGTSQRPVAFASLPDGPPRILAFAGKLTRSDTTPITANTSLRFAIYNDGTASGSAQLWQEAQTIQPDQEGNFRTMLGKLHPIPQRLFTDNARLYIGMSVDNESELKPRREIPTEVLAATSETVQGLRPITDPAAGEKNTLLALDSSGNLSIGGKANPVFIARGGSFTLSGHTLILSTTPESNTDVVIAPDGTGKIDIRRPLHNTSNTSTIPGTIGAVEIADSLAINSSQSSQSALFINQNTTGPLISAGVSGIAKFTLANTGAATFGDTVTLEGAALGTTQTSFNLLTTSAINLAIGNAATSISLGNSGGTTTINNSQTVVSGNLSVNGSTGLSISNANAGINFSGQGNHLISATAGSLQLGAVALNGATYLAQNVSLVPSNVDGENNLGSQANPFDTLYVNSIVSPGFAQPNIWQNTTGLLTPNQPFLSLGVGGSASSSAVWQVFATGAESGTASSSGNLSFTGQNTTVKQLNGGSLSFQTSPGGEAELTTRMTLLANGNVGIGTSTPQNQLDLGSGTGEALNWVSTSSRRFKSDVSPINDPLGKIGRLQGVYYNWDQAHGGKRGLGFIAEDLGQVLPEAVEWEADGVNAKGISYGLLSALAIEGIKAQQEQITRVESMVNQFALSKDRQFHIIQVEGDRYTVLADNQDPMKSRAGFAEVVTASIRAGNALVRTLKTNSLHVISGVIDSLTTEHLASTYIETKDIRVTDSISAAHGAILSLRTEEISSGQADAGLSLGIGRNELVIYGLADTSKTQVASIDHIGNASFAGIIKANEAVIAGNLTAGKLVADELDLTDDGMLKLIARMASLDTNNPVQTESIQSLPTAQTNSSILPAGSPRLNATASASPEPAIPGSIPNGVEPEVVTEYHDFASSSASLLMAPVASSGATVTPIPDNSPDIPAGSGLVLADLSVADTISISGNFILSKGGLDVVGEDLQLQPLRAGGVSFLAGLMKLDTAGNLVVEGNASFARDLSVKGKLAANVISPLQDNLTVQLGKETDSSLIINNASGEAKLQIKNTGDLESDGDARFSSLLSKSLSIIRGSQVDASPVSTIASSSAGTATILPGQTQRTVFTPFVTRGSLVYITPTSDTGGVVPYIARQTIEDARLGSEGSFTIEINQKISKPIKVNWWIVN